MGKVKAKESKNMDKYGQMKNIWENITRHAFKNLY